MVAHGRWAGLTGVNSVKHCMGSGHMRSMLCCCLSWVGSIREMRSLLSQDLIIGLRGVMCIKQITVCGYRRYISKTKFEYS